MRAQNVDEIDWRLTVFGDGPMQGWWSRRLCKVLSFREILFIYNYLGLKKTLALHIMKTKQKPKHS